MFGKVMSISDEMMYRYYELLTDLSVAEIVEKRRQASSGGVNPMEHKIELARRIVSDFHSPQAGREAEEQFRRVFQKREAPANMARISLGTGANLGMSGSITRRIKLDRLLAENGLASSVSEASRKIKEGGLQVNGERYEKPVYEYDPDQVSELVLKFGRQYLTVELKTSQN
jgi:tyrosyl-tRNA synthetase